jgi:hypothetical protein
MHEDSTKDILLGKPGAPPKASPELVLKLRKGGMSARQTGEVVGLSTRRVQQITAEYLRKQKEEGGGPSTSDTPAQPEASASNHLDDTSSDADASAMPSESAQRKGVA